jgi:hypothetical protein
MIGPLLGILRASFIRHLLGHALLAWILSSASADLSLDVRVLVRRVTWLRLISLQIHCMPL